MGFKSGRRRAWASFPTEVIIGSAESDAISIGSPVGDNYGVPLVAPEEILSFHTHGHNDAWTSDSGTGYIASEDSSHLIVHDPGDGWSRLPVDFGQDMPAGKLSLIIGYSGACPKDDEIFVIVAPDDEQPICILLWRKHGRWTPYPLGPGKVLAMTAATATTSRGVYISVGTTDGEPHLLFFTNGELREVAYPANIDGSSCGAATLSQLPDGSLFACFVGRKSGQLTCSIRNNTGQWRPLAMSHSSHCASWMLSDVQSLVWRKKLYLTTKEGLCELSEKPLTLLRVGLFHGISLWPLQDALICRGWRAGTYAHEINRGDGWQPYLIADPDTVFGGRGKVVWVPPKRKIPVRKIRMQTKRPRPGRAAVRSADDRHFADVLATLEGASKRQEPIAATSLLADMFGTTLAPALASYFSVYGYYKLNVQFGLLNVWTEDDVPLQQDIVRRYSTLPTIIGTLCNVIVLGSDGGGQDYLAEVNATSNEVFLYSTGTLKFLADSMPAFMFLNELTQRWLDLETERDIDVEDVIDGNISRDDPAVNSIIAGLASLKDRVNLSDDESQITSDFDEMLPPIANITPDAKPKSATLPLFEGAHWLIMALDGIYVDAANARTRTLHEERADSDWWSLAAVRVYWLWHLYLLDTDDDELAALLATLDGDPSSLVRDTAEMISSLYVSTESPGEFGRFAALRLEFQEGKTDEGTLDRIAAAPHLAIDGGDSDNVREAKTALNQSAKDLVHPQRWDALLYAYYLSERFADMITAVNLRIRLHSADYYPWLQLGIARGELGKVDDALEAYDRALVFRPHDAASWMNKSNLYAERGDRENALAHLRWAIHYNGDHRQTALENADFAAFKDDPLFLQLVQHKGIV